MLVLWILPFWTNALLEKVVVRLDSELRGGSDVVLRGSIRRIEDGAGKDSHRHPRIPRPSRMLQPP